jgi:hypothetical protein
MILPSVPGTSALAAVLLGQMLQRYSRAKKVELKSFLELPGTNVKKPAITFSP